jgi:hypothetical protein
MNKFSRNFELLIEDLKIPLKRAISNYKNEKDQFKIVNKKEVLYLYRHMLKNIPSMHKNLLEKRCVYEVL